MAGSFMVGAITAKLALDKTGFSAAIQQVEKSVQSLGGKFVDAGKKLDSMGKNLSNMGRQLSMTVSAPLLAIGAASLKMAMDAQESENLFEVSMGAMAGAARGWSQEISKSLGLNQYEVRKTVGTFNVMFDSMGIGEQAAYKMAKGLTQLTYDMASFYNMKPEEAFQKLQAGISGEVEPLKRLGIIINETTVKHWALTHGVIKQGEELTEEQKVMARYNVIMEQTSKAQGDLARTIDSPTNKLRLLKSQAAEMGIELGQRLIPIFQSVMDTVKKGLAYWDGLSDKQKDLAVKIGLVVAALGPLMMGLGRVMSLVGALTKGFGGVIQGVSSLASKLTLSITAWMAVAAAVGYYILKLREKKEAEEYAEKAGKRSQDLYDRYTEKLWAVAKAAGVNREEWEKLTQKYNENSNGLRQAILAGEAGAAAQQALAGYTAKTAEENQKAKEKTDTYKLALDNLTGGLTGAKKASEEWADYLKGAGVLALKDQQTEIDKLYGYLKTLDQMFKEGKLTKEMYAKAVKQVSDDLKDMGVKTNLVLPPARDLFGIIKQAVPPTEDLAQAIEYSDEVMGWWAEKIGVSTTELKMYIYEVARLRLALLGFQMPDINWDQFMGGVKDVAKDTYDAFDNLWSDVARGFGDTFKGVVSGAVKMKDALGQIWGNVKDAIFSMLGEVVTRWVKSLLTDMVGTATKAAASTATAFSGLGATVGGIATSIGTIITTLATAIGTAIGTIAAGIGTALVTIATAIATAATVLAAAAAAIITVGVLAVALYAAFKIVGSVIDKLFGGGGGGGKERELLHDIRNFSAEIRNAMTHVNPSLDYLKASLDLTRDALKGTIDETRTSLFGAINTARVETCKRLDQIVNAISRLPKAQAGGLFKRPSLVHVAEKGPEAIIPLSQMGRTMGKTINITVPVNLNGTILTDREYVRGRFMDELIAALKAGVKKAALQGELGV